jgi:hypothetical protein
MQVTERKLLRIVNTTGIAQQTKVFAGEQEISGVTRIEIDPIHHASDFITAQITVACEVDLTIGDAHKAKFK